jgi:hypothetical protein
MLLLFVSDKPLLLLSGMPLLAFSVSGKLLLCSMIAQ